MINILFPHKRYSFINESVLEDLSDENIDLIERHKIKLKLKKGEVLFHEGTISIGLYILRSGKIKKYNSGIEGKQHIFYLVKEKELLGHHALISGEPHSGSAACLVNCEVDIIPKDIFLQIMYSSDIVLNKLLKSMAHEFGVFTNNSRILAQHSVRERCAISIIKLKEFLGDANGGFKISRKDHSNIVGTSVESLVRVLHDFKEEELIEVNQNNLITIKNPIGLVEISNMV